jgi:hypothetical protein
MNKMITPDCEEISIAAVNHHFQLWIRELKPGGKWNGTAVSCMKTVQLDISSHPAGAANARDYADLI